MARILLRNVRAGKRRNLIEELNVLVLAELDIAMNQARDAIVKSLKLVVADWKSDVSFAGRKFIRPNLLWVNAFPTGKDKEVWFYVDGGTEPHTIPFKGTQFKFSSGEYIPKTLFKPARVVSGGGRTVGGKIVYVDHDIDHPGSDPRNFTKEIAEDIKPGFKRVTENAFRRVNRRIQE